MQLPAHQAASQTLNLTADIIDTGGGVAQVELAL
jgi:hypothetical protein